MAKKPSVSIVVVASATTLPQAVSTTLQWDGRSGVCRAVGPQTFSEQVQPSSF